jgi:NDP-sugar pyrophosphorylase family protein
MFCGIHVTRPSVVRMLPEGQTCMVRQGYLPWIQSDRGEVCSFEHRGYFKEHSTPQLYLEGNLAVVGGAALRFPPGDTTGVHPSARVAESATILPPVRIGPDAVVEADATIGPATVIGRRATVAAGSRITRSVVWHDARAAGDLDTAIVTPREVVELA